MIITAIDMGNIGSGLAGLWRRADHGVAEIGREAAKAATTDVILVTVPSGAISDPGEL